jgi:chromosome segregation ATPase
LSIPFFYYLFAEQDSNEVLNVERISRPDAIKAKDFASKMDNILREMRTMILNVFNKVETLQVDKTNLAQENTDLKSKIQALESEKSGLSQDKAMLDEDLKKIIQKKKELEQNVDQLTNIITELKNNAADDRKMVKELCEKNDSLNNKNQRSEEEVTTVKLELELEKASFENC